MVSPPISFCTGRRQRAFFIAIAISIYGYAMSSGSNLSKSRQTMGISLIVTTGKSKHEAILLECNTDDPKQFLDEQINVKIRWKVAR